MRIGDAADLLAVSTKTLRHWHRVGLLPEPERAGNGYRHYPASTVVLARQVRRLRDAGLPLSRIRALLVAADPAASVTEELVAARGEVLAGIGDLRARLARIEAALDAPDTWAVVTGRTDATTAAEWDDVLLSELDDLDWPTGALAPLGAAAATPDVIAAVAALGELFDRAATGGAPDPAEIDVLLAGLPLVRVDDRVAAVLRAVVRDRLATGGLSVEQCQVVERLLERDPLG